MPEIVCGRSAQTWRRACARGTAWLADAERASRWAVQNDSLDAIGLSRRPFGAALAEVSAFACGPFPDEPAAEQPRAAAPRRPAPPKREAAAKTVVQPVHQAMHRAPRERANVPPDVDEPVEHVAPSTGPGSTAATTAGQPVKRPRLADAATCRVPRARLASLAGDVSRMPSFDASPRTHGPRARAEVVSTVADAAAVRRRDAVPIVSGDAAAACRALAQRVVERGARVVAPASASRPHERAGAGAPPNGDAPRATAPPASQSTERSDGPSRAEVIPDERRRRGAAEALATAWRSCIEPSDVTFEHVAPVVRAEAQSPAPSPPAPGASSREPRSGGATPPRESAFEPAAPRAPAHRLAAYPPRDLLAPTARRNVAAETDPARIDAPVIDGPSRPLTPLRARRGFPFPAAAPLSVAESVAEERPAFDSVVFAEQVRAALVHDARRHGIDV